MKLRAMVLAWIACAPVVAFAADSIPTGWIKAGSHPTEYEVGVDSSIRHAGRASGYLKATTTDLHGFGTLMQTSAPGDYRGKRVRLSAFVRSQSVDSGWAGVWLRIDGARERQSQTPAALGFDNMQNRPIKGTTDWTRVEIVLDVPAQAADIAFGILLAGNGEVWLDDLKFDVVPSSVPLTGSSPRLTSPTNLGFEN